MHPFGEMAGSARFPRQPDKRDEAGLDDSEFATEGQSSEQSS